VLGDGNARANDIADATLREVRSTMGMVYPSSFGEAIGPAVPLASQS